VVSVADPSSRDRGKQGAGSRLVGGLLPMDWGELGPLRLRARVLAEGYYAGLHRSRRRGAGVEYGGQRPYVPGDDLRFLDRRSLLKHDRLMIREFETDTERALWLCVDASDSMAFRGAGAPGPKLAYAALLAAALARVALAGQDPVALSWLGPSTLRELGVSAGELAFERIVAALEATGPAGALLDEPETVSRAIRRLARRAARGSMIVVLSDLLDLPLEARDAVAALGARSRALVVVQVLDPVERDLAYQGKVRLRAIEGRRTVETDVDAVRGQYRARLEAHAAAWAHAVQREGGRLVRCCSTDRPSLVLREIVRACAEARR
jgi:uncharacterized protein (DUF58 family)